MRPNVLPAAVALALLAGVAAAAEPPRPGRAEPAKPEAVASAAPDQGLFFKPEAVETQGSVAVEGRRVDYRAVAGAIVVHPKGWDDAAAREPAALGGRPGDPSAPKPQEGDGDKANPSAEASMFYVAYFAKGAAAADRPVTFLFNGGPGSSTVWLHMGAFGPRRVVTADDSHTPAAPYRVVDNAYSLLDASDLVFIDAPGTGFSRIAGKDKEKGFYGVDPDAYAFTQFITAFLSRYNRWNSPKYLFGESYGTPRASIVAGQLATGNDVDLNGVILLSQILNFDLSADAPQYNPGSDEAYVTALPTYAASAWYHNRLAARPAELRPFLTEVERFAAGDYAQALQAGSELEPGRRQAVAERFAHYTGLPLAYVLKADLRVDGGMFEKMLQDPSGVTTGRLDTRFSGPDIDPLSKEADYDPQSASISSAYVAAFNDYVRRTLNYGVGRVYRPETDVGKDWTFSHQPPGATSPIPGIANLMPDLAVAMKYNPGLKVMVNGGYYDLATPYYEGWYEMHHMPIPAKLQGNIEYNYYESGHMVYAHEPALKALHDNVAGFIARTNNIQNNPR